MDMHTALPRSSIGIGIAAVGWASARAYMRAIGRQPEATAENQLAMIIAALAEALTIYAFVTMFLLKGLIG
jgi:F0F1-type ATP synthase membrane subunit c/vacuolar-type H+-ATPase subunit K